MSPDSAEIQYDIGLVYVELGDYKQANLYAARAYQGGYPLPGLRHKLERLGQWSPPVLPPATQNTQAPAPADQP
jgi:hypothetical protein